MLRRDPCVAADPNGPATTRHRGARRCHAAGCRAAQASRLPRAQVRRPAAAPCARLPDRRALERSSAAARLGARSSPTGPAGTASRSPFRLDETVAGDSGSSGAAGSEQHDARKPGARAPAREPAKRCGKSQVEILSSNCEPHILKPDGSPIRIRESMVYPGGGCLMYPAKLLRN